MPLPIVGLSALLKALYAANHQEELPEEPFTPFDLSYLQQMPRDTDRSAPTERLLAPPSGAYPPPVPNN